MRILFNIEYHTDPGHALALCIVRGEGVVERHPMTSYDCAYWMLTHECDSPEGASLTYYYMVTDSEQAEVRREWPLEPHRLEFAAKGAADYMVFDRWTDIPEDAYMYSSAFTLCVNSRELQPCVPTSFARTIQLKVHATQLHPGEQLAVVGAPIYLGAWNPQRALPMSEHADNEWVIGLDADRLPGLFEYKFVIIGRKGKRQAPTPQETTWEQGNNRFVDVPDLRRGQVAVYELPQALFAERQWKGAGTVIPVFSLRSEGSFGVGDFGDLKLMIDWCAVTGQRVLQVLPINDTNHTGTWQDSYPYNAISIYALHPQYADLRQLPPIADEQLRQQMEQTRQELNALPQIDYERMFSAKMCYLQAVYSQEYAKTRRTKAYKDFVEHNKEWLEPYARFCVMHHGADGGAATEETFWHFIQYHLDRQMRAAHDHARQQHVILKGDIPIGVSRDGVEAWAEPRYFYMDEQAGAPPDAFTADGQNWGFPTYNWDEMLADDCQWWVRRFRKMAEYFDAYRIDHVLGFFRIWEIPVTQQSGLYGQFQPALPLTVEEIEQRWHLPFHQELYLEDHRRKGMWHPRINATQLDAFAQLPAYEQQRFWDMYNDYFYRRNNQFWYEQAMKKLPRLTEATRMLCCAEDLGMVPDCVPWVMNELRILTLEIQSMPKEPNLRFGKLSHNPYRSVDTISTHDMPTLRQWWDEDPERTQAYYNGPLRRSGEAPHPLPVWLAKEIVYRHLTSPSMLCLISLQDWLATEPTPSASTYRHTHATTGATACTSP